MATRVIVADDHPFFILGVETVFAPLPHLEIVATANGSDQLMAALKNPCDVLITDFSMPGGRQQDGLRLVSTIRRQYPALKIIVLTMHDNAGVLGSIARMDVAGLVSKADVHEELVSAVQTVVEGRSYLSRCIRRTIGIDGLSRLPAKTKLSPREAEVLRLFSSGMTGNEIAESLHRSKKTISRQKVSAFHKLGVSSNVEFFVYLREMRGQEDWLRANGDYDLDSQQEPAAGPAASVTSAPSSDAASEAEVS